jgi:LuxR family transcriptional regulator, maltose regulon positive regulatory protein
MPDSRPSAQPGDVSISHTVPSTKFRRPHLHPDMVPREALVGRLQRATLAHRVCLVRAPGGYGKTTLLTQLAERCDADGSAQTVWLSLDEGENDVNRLLLLLLCALQDVPLHWAVEPRLLAAGAPQADASVGILVNALQTYRAGRLLIVLDDLHRVVDAAAASFIESLAELLPSHVVLVLGTRTEPALPIARWRMRGELALFGSDDLQFNASDAQRMMQRAAARELDDAIVQQALKRSEGWAAGLQLILRSRSPEAGQPLAARGTDKALFDYFANESFATLPDALQDFLVRCSVLEELSPALCRAVTGREDASQVLSSLAQQSLFLTVIDEMQPVLRLHDLFAAFLRHKLAQRGEGAVRELHALAAAAEQPTRAVAHWLAAHEWEAAVGQIAQVAPSLLAEGGAALLVRWLEGLPQAFARRSADAQRLHAMAAASRWDFAGATVHLEAAMQAYRAEGRQHDFLACAAQLPRLCHAAGLLDKGAALIAYTDTLPLDREMRLMADAGRVWQCLATRPGACAPLLESIAARVQAEPALLPAAMENLNVPHFQGMPGVLPVMRRLRELCMRQRAAGDRSWQLAAMSAMVWPELWHGDRTLAEEAMARSAELYEQLAVVPTTRFNALAEQAFLTCAAGDTERAVLLQLDICEQMANISPGFSATWERLIRFCLAQMLLSAGDHAQLHALWPLLGHPRTPFEYPVVEALRTRFQGHMAWLAGDLVTAELRLEEAAGLEVHWRLPTLCGDARPALARLRLEQGDAAGAWNGLSGLLDEMLTDDCIGPLLVEAPAHRAALVAVIPAQTRAQPAVQRLLERLAAWQRPAAPPAASAQPLGSLTPRERAVLERLAAGESNQLIADGLHISLHTVKRHVVSVLAKLGCDTRGQAAARWHANTPEARGRTT